MREQSLKFCLFYSKTFKTIKVTLLLRNGEWDFLKDIHKIVESKFCTICIDNTLNLKLE